jgi:hypothetical protein
VLWNNYLNEYVAKSYDVEFKFVPAPGQDEAAGVTAVENFASQGVKGIIGIIDTPAVIKKADDLGIYYVRSGGLQTEASYAQTKSLKHYLGTFGPDTAPGGEEYSATYEMTKDYLAQGKTKFLVYAALMGLGIPSDMHVQRFYGIRDALVEAGMVFTPGPGASLGGQGAVGTFQKGTSNLEAAVIQGLGGYEAMDADFIARLTTAVSGHDIEVCLLTVEGYTLINTLLLQSG